MWSWSPSMSLCLFKAGIIDKLDIVQMGPNSDYVCGFNATGRWNLIL
jgi:hypothetical protein